MLGQWENWDATLLRVINREWACGALDWVMAVVCSEKLFLPLIAGAVLGLLLFGGVKGRIAVVLVALNLAVGDGLVNQGIRRAVQRPRPAEAVVGTRKVTWDDWAPKVRETRKASAKPGGRSFPSGHVINNVTALVTLAWFYRWLAPWAAGWIVLMGVARVYTGAHYFSDVVGTVWLGLAVSGGILLAAEGLRRALRTRLPAAVAGFGLLDLGRARG